MKLCPDAQGQLALDGVNLHEIAAQFGTPCYVYSQHELDANFQAFRQAFPNALICYAMKANSNLSLLQQFARQGGGCDIVSGGELARALAAGVPAERIVFSGVAKTRTEMRDALLAGIHCFNVESEAELYRLNEVATELDMQAPISLRINPDVDAKTHPYISTGLKDNKFGIAYADARRVYGLAAKLSHLSVRGMDCHIGSQLLDIQPLVDALDRLLSLTDSLAQDGIVLAHLDLGGGLGIPYTSEQAGPDLAAYAQAVGARLAGRNLQLIMEPGRALVGNAGLLLTRIEYLKPGVDKQFAIVDAAMNDLLRPALYSAWHEIVAVTQRSGEAQRYDIVGPVCESSDFLGRDRMLTVAQGDLLAVLSAGAYGFTMSSNYNTRPRAAEVMVTSNGPRLIRQRESIEELLANERALLF